VYAVLRHISRRKRKYGMNKRKMELMAMGYVFVTN
jgi:hypothetical protein